MNRVVVVTGGTRGIGFACAKTFLKHGDKVVVASIDNEDIVKSSMDELSKYGEVSFLNVMWQYRKIVRMLF